MVQSDFNFCLPQLFAELFKMDLAQTEIGHFSNRLFTLCFHLVLGICKQVSKYFGMIISKPLDIMLHVFIDMI